MMSHKERRARLFAGLNDVLGFVNGVRDRLFEKDVAYPRRKRLIDRLNMQAVRQSDSHRIKLLLTQQQTIIFVALQSQFTRKRFRLRTESGNGDEFHLVMLKRIFYDLRSLVQPKYCQLYWFHASPFLPVSPFAHTAKQNGMAR